MNDTVRLLSFHLRMLPCAVTIAYPFGSTGTLEKYKSRKFLRSDFL
jgi:hypothetical protein